MVRFATGLVLMLAATVPAPAEAEELVKFRVVDDNAIPESLTGASGDPVRGQKVAVDRGLGNCLACHAMPVNEPLQGNVGPTLVGVGSRLTEAELRLRVVNPKILNTQTAMPAFYRIDGLYRVRKDLVGKPILSAEQVEDIVAYLKTLKE